MTQVWKTGGISVGATPTPAQGEGQPRAPLTGPPRHCTWYGPPGAAAAAQGESTAPAGGGGEEGHAGTAEGAGGQRGALAAAEREEGRDGPVRRALGAGAGKGMEERGRTLADGTTVIFLKL